MRYPEMNVYKIYYRCNDDTKLYITKVLEKDISIGKDPQNMCCKIVAKESLPQFEGKKIFMVAIN